MMMMILLRAGEEE